ncbi:hypothetical protein AD428_19300, partial [Achromobacter sp. DMS1]
MVNTIDNRIPTEPIQGVQGQIQGEYGGANTSRSGSARVEGGDGTFAVHADVFAAKPASCAFPRCALGPRAGRRSGRGLAPTAGCPTATAATAAARWAWAGPATA